MSNSICTQFILVIRKHKGVAHIRQLNLFSLFSLTILLSGITYAENNIGQKSAGTKGIVISLQGDQFHLHHIGFSIFSNAKKDVDISSWEIDEFTEHHVQKVINASGKSTAVAAGKKYRQNFGAMEVNKWTGNISYQSLGHGIKALSDKEPVDYILLIKPAFNGSAFPNPQFQVYFGNGIYQDASLKDPGNAVNFTIMEMILLDAKTGKVISSFDDYESSSRSADDWISDKSLPFTGKNEESSKRQLMTLINELLEKGLAELRLTQ